MPPQCPQGRKTSEGKPDGDPALSTWITLPAPDVGESMESSGFADLGQCCADSRVGVKYVPRASKQCRPRGEYLGLSGPSGFRGDTPALHCVWDAGATRRGKASLRTRGFEFPDVISLVNRPPTCPDRVRSFGSLAGLPCGQGAGVGGPPFWRPLSAGPCRLEQVAVLVISVLEDALRKQVPVVCPGQSRTGW